MNRKTMKLAHGGEVLDAAIESGEGRLTIDTVAGRRSWDLDGRDGDIVLRDEAGTRRIAWARRGDDVWLALDGRTWHLRRHHPEHAAAGAAVDADHAEIVAPMVGRVAKIHAGEGTAVAEGDAVIVVEAMKMEHPLRAPFDGSVESLSCEEGEQVDMGQVLAVLARSGEAE